MFDFDALREIAKGRIPKEEVVGYRTNPETHTVFPITAEQEAAHPVKDIEKHKDILRSVASHVSGERGGDYRHTDRMAAKVLGVEEVHRLAKERGHEGRAGELETPEQAEAKKRKERLDELDAKIAEHHSSVAHPAFHAMAKRLADDNNDAMLEVSGGARMSPDEEALRRKDNLHRSYQTAGRLKNMIDSKDATKLLENLHSGNKASRRAFEQYTGISLGTNEATTRAGILKHAGADEAEKFKAKEAADAKAREERKIADASGALERKLSGSKVNHNGVVKTKAEWIQDLVKDGYHYPVESKSGIVRVVDAHDASGTSYKLKGDERTYYLQELAKANVSPAPKDTQRMLIHAQHAADMKDIDARREKIHNDYLYGGRHAAEAAYQRLDKEKQAVIDARDAKLRGLGDTVQELSPRDRMKIRHATELADHSARGEALQQQISKATQMSKRVELRQQLQEHHKRMGDIWDKHSKEEDAMDDQERSGNAAPEVKVTPEVSLSNDGEDWADRHIRAGLITKDDISGIKARVAKYKAAGVDYSESEAIADAVKERLALPRDADLVDHFATQRAVQQAEKTKPRAAKEFDPSASPLAGIDDSDKLYHHTSKDVHKFPQSRAILQHALNEKMRAPHRQHDIDRILPESHTSNMSGKELHDLARRITETASMSDADIAAGKHVDAMPKHFGGDAAYMKIKGVEETPVFKPDDKRVHSLEEGAKRVAQAQGSMATHPALQAHLRGRYLTSDGKQSHYVATNGHAMTIVPVDHAEAMERLKAHGANYPTRHGDYAHIEMPKGDTYQPEARDFPDYKQVVPRENPHHETAVDVPTLQALAKVAPGATHADLSGSTGIQLTAKGGDLYASVHGGYGHDVKVGKAPASWKENDRTIVSADLLNKHLKGRKGTSVLSVEPLRRKDVPGFLSPTVWKHPDGVKDIIMPMRGR